MSREVKYQAWIPELNKMVQVVSHNFEVGGTYFKDSNGRDGFINKGVILREFTGLMDKKGKEIFEKDITEFEVDGEFRRFVVGIKTVIRNVVSHPSFDDETAKVAITGVVFEWNGFELFPCVDENSVFDNLKMTVVGNIYENPELLEETE